MEVQSTSNTNAYQAQAPSTKVAAKNDGNQFMLMLMAQLKNQNPLDPASDKDMMGQMAQLNSLEALTAIKTSMQDSAQASQSTYAVSLIGKKIKATQPNGDMLEGLVTGASLMNGNMVLRVDDKDVKLSSVVEVTGAEK